MNDILSKITPLTRGIIWLYKETPTAATKSYQTLDYLLNGLLTASLNANPNATGQVLISNNFHGPLHVYIVKSLVSSEYESFIKLLQKDLGSESTVLVIDEVDGYNTLLDKTPQALKSHYQVFTMK